MTLRSLVAHAAMALAVVSLLATRALAAEAVYPLGSRIGLVPPGAMKPSASFRGFEDRDTNASMLILEMPPQAFPEVEKQMSPAALKKQGMIGGKARDGHAQARQGPADRRSAGRRQQEGAQVDLPRLHAGGHRADRGPGAGRRARPSIPTPTCAPRSLSMTVRPTVPIDEQLRLLPITFDDLSGMRPFRVSGNNAVFLTDGPKRLARCDRAAVARRLGRARRTRSRRRDRDNFARNLFSGLTDFKDVRIVGTDLLRLGNHADPPDPGRGQGRQDRYADEAGAVGPLRQRRLHAFRRGRARRRLGARRFRTSAPCATA